MIDKILTKIERWTRKCIGESLQQLDAVETNQPTKELVKKSIWELSDKIADEIRDLPVDYNSTKLDA